MGGIGEALGRAGISERNVVYYSNLGGRVGDSTDEAQGCLRVTLEIVVISAGEHEGEPCHRVCRGGAWEGHGRAMGGPVTCSGRDGGDVG